MGSNPTLSARHVDAPAANRGKYLRHAVRVSQLSIAWSAAAGSAGAVVGVVAGSVALLGFGLNSVVDAAASGVLVHRFHTERQSPHRADDLEHRARRILGVALLVIGVYVGVSAVNELASHEEPERTTVGILIALASVVALPPLAVYKRRTANELGSAALRADSVLTTIAAALAAGALVGLLVTEWFEWWWADSAIALAMVGVLLREGLGVLRVPPP